MYRRSSPFLVAVSCVFGTTSVMAGTGVGGTITTTTWTKGNGPYYVLSAVTVPLANTLTIQPGVDVIFEADVRFIVQGRLQAVGTESDSIRFIKGSAAQWAGLTLSKGDTSTLSYVRISQVSNARAGLTADSSARAGMTNVNIRGNSGGGVSNSYEARLTMTNCTISGNSASHNYYYGGGVYNYYDAALTMTNCTISGNSAYYYSGGGGGLYAVSSTVTLTNCTITRNSASGNYGGGGGLYAVSSTVTLTNCTISANSAPSNYYGGGGLYAGYSTLTLTNCAITGNSVAYGTDQGNGGGLHIEGNSTVTLTNCTIRGNTVSGSASCGGGLRAVSSTVTLANCTITGNSAYYYGGGLYAVSATVALMNCTIAGNSAGVNGGGLYIVWTSTVTLKNTILWGNGTQDYYNLGGGAFSGTYSDIRQGSGTYPGAGNINADPLFADAAKGDYRLRAGSPCINAGDPNSPKDPDGSRADMGALPYGSPPLAVFSSPTPSLFALAQNSPNPFNPTTTIRFTVPQSGPVNLTIWAVAGQIVRTLVDGTLPAGQHEVVWDGADAAGRRVASGVYFYRLTAGEGTVVRKMTLIR